MLNISKDKTIIFGHRGYPGKFAENSLEGFKFAVNNHAEGVEFDVHLTKDNVPVVMHDEQVDRTTNGTGYIKDFTFKELQQLRLANGEQVPELETVLALLDNQNILINLEFKTGIVHYPGIEQIVLDLTQQFNFLHPLIFSSFDYNTLKRCQKIDPNQVYCLLADTGLDNALKVVEENNFNGIHPGKLITTEKPVIQRVWTVDDPKTAQECFQNHVAGIFTNNYPEMIKLRDQIQK